MGKVFEFLGLTVAVVRDDDNPQQNRAAFSADVTYTTAALLAFTYLRDNTCADEADLVRQLVLVAGEQLCVMSRQTLDTHSAVETGAGAPDVLVDPTYLTRMHVWRCGAKQAPRVQALVRPFHYAIVDEVDSVLIDDCRNPFILSARAETFNTDRYVLAAKVCAHPALPSLHQCSGVCWPPMYILISLTGSSWRARVVFEARRSMGGPSMVS